MQSLLSCFDFRNQIQTFLCSPGNLSASSFALPWFNTYYLLSLSLLIVCAECSFAQSEISIYLSNLSMYARRVWYAVSVSVSVSVHILMGPDGAAVLCCGVSGVVCIPTVFNFWRFVAALNGLLAVIVAGCVDEAPFVCQTIRIRICI